MSSFFSVRSKIITTFKGNIRSIAFEGLSLTIMLSLILIILLSNIFRVLQNGQNNYKVFTYEKDSLEELRQRNEDLEFELEATSTEEYKRLLAREVLGLAAPNEDLFRTKDDTNFYEQEVILYDIKEKNNYGNWWGMILK